jgi:hypothetical protein
MVLPGTENWKELIAWGRLRRSCRSPSSSAESQPWFRSVRVRERAERAGGAVAGTRVLMSDLLEGFECVSAGEFVDAVAYVSLDTGVVYLVGEGMEADDDTPADPLTSNRYRAIPARRHLDLGKTLALCPARRHMPNDVDAIAGYFRHPGACARLMELVDGRGRPEQWFEFEAKSVHVALAEWCSGNDLELVADSPAR